MEENNIITPNMDEITAYLEALQLKLSQVTHVLTIAEDVVMHPEDTPNDITDKILALTSILKSFIEERDKELLELTGLL